MIDNFEDFTHELSDDELKLVPLVISGFKNYTINNPIKSDTIVKRMNEFLTKNDYPIKMSGVRLRKIVNHIRTNGLQPLIATSKGYFVSEDKEVIQEQINSLNQRANSIKRCADGLSKYLK